MTTNSKIEGYIPEKEIFRYKVYKRLFQIQIGLIISGFIVVEFIKIAELPVLKSLIIASFFLAGAGYFYILRELLGSFV